jgi:hypothetical protein
VAGETPNAFPISFRVTVIGMGANQNLLNKF